MAILTTTQPVKLLKLGHYENAKAMQAAETARFLSGFKMAVALWQGLQMVQLVLAGVSIEGQQNIML